MDGKFWPPKSRKHFNRFWPNLKLITTTWRPLGMQDHILLRQRGWSGWTPSLPLEVSFLALFFFLSFFWFLQHAPRSHQWTDLHQIWHVSAVSAKDVPFGGLNDDQSRLRVQTPKNQNYGGVNRHFKPNLQIIQIVISSKLCIGLA